MTLSSSFNNDGWYGGSVYRICIVTLVSGIKGCSEYLCFSLIIPFSSHPCLYCNTLTVIVHRLLSEQIVLFLRNFWSPSASVRGCSFGQLLLLLLLLSPRLAYTQTPNLKDGSRSSPSMVYGSRWISCNRFGSDRIQLSTPLNLQESIRPVTRTQLESSTFRMAHR